MPSHEVHNSNDMIRFGVSFPEVHQELDSTFSVGYVHRSNTHYLEYVLDRLKTGHWTIEQTAAAIHHIIDDCHVLMLKSDWSSGEELVQLAREKEEDAN